MSAGRDGILHRLTNADRAHQRERGGSLVLRSLKWVLVFVVLCLALDVFVHLQPGWRLAMLLATIVGALGLLGCGWYLAYVRRNRLERVARLLEERDPALGSKLINILQLEGQASDPSLAPLTRTLARRAVDDYGEELRKVPFERLARTRLVIRELKRAGLALLGFALVLGVFYRVTGVELPRFLDPFGDHPPYSLTQLEITDPGGAGTNVIYGRSFVIKAKSIGHRPKEVFLTAHSPGHPEQSITLPMFDKGSAGFHQQLESIRGELVVFAHTKDRASISKQARLGVILTPQLDKAFVQVAPPAYTGIKPEEKPHAFKGVQALAGSTVRFRLQSNRPLREGALDLAAVEGQPQRIRLVRSATNEVAGSFVAKDSGRIRLGLVDVDGIPSQEVWESALTVTHDLPPEVAIAEPNKDSFIALDFKVTARIQADDDYGLKTVRLHRGLNGVYSAPKVVNYAGITRSAHETADFDFAELGVQAGDVISLFAEAIDNAPEGHLVRSETIHLTVISVEDYNNFLRERLDLTTISQKYDELIANLHDLIEQQKKLGQAAEQARERLAKADAQDRERLQRELDNLLARQSELNQKLNKQAELMENFVRESPVYDVEKELQKDLREFANTVRQSTHANDSASKQIAQRSAPPSGQRNLDQGMFGDFKEASDEQVRRLGGVEDEAQENVGETLADMAALQELLKDFNQFESLYKTQRALTDQTRAYNRAGQLEREDQLALKDMASTEKQVGDLLDRLAEKLREDAQAAEKNFPKAAQSGRELAEKIEALRLTPLARKATDQMLAANGEGSYQSADRLRGEMEKLFKQCNGGNCPAPGELDQYLQLVRSMKAGKTFSQMKRSRNFARPGSQRGNGVAQGEGDGQSGESGSAVNNQQAMDVMGNESFISRTAASDKMSSKAGLGMGKAGDASAGPAVDKPDTVKGLNPVNRQSGAVRSESVYDEYSDVVDKYFKAITK